MLNENQPGTDNVLLDIRDGVATITLNRPDVHNAFDEHVIAALHGKLDALALERDLRVIVLRGAGKNFSAGADLVWMMKAANYTQEQNKSDALALAGMLNKLYSMPQTTIACVHGAAMGGGFGLVACCDIVLATERASFALSEVKIGLIPATIGPYVMKAIGERHMRRFAQTGERFGAGVAHQIGLVHEVLHDDSALADRLNEILDGIAANGPDAVREAKALCNELANQPITPKLLDHTATRIAEIRAGGEAKEGLSAFLEKRKPGWVK